MALLSSEVESPFLEDWEFEDELGIVLDIGRFIVPNVYEEEVGARMSESIINDGRRVACRTETFYGADSIPITFARIPYNYAMELRNRVGARFRIKNHLGDHIWAVLRRVRLAPLHMHVTVRNEQRYNAELEFTQVSPS